MIGVNFTIEHKGIHVATIICTKLEDLDTIFDRIKRRKDFYAFACSSLSLFPEPITGWAKLQEKHDKNIEEQIFKQLQKEDVKVISVTYFQSKNKVKIMVRDKEEMDKLALVRIKLGEDYVVA